MGNNLKNGRKSTVWGGEIIRKRSSGYGWGKKRRAVFVVFSKIFNSMFNDSDSATIDKSLPHECGPRAIGRRGSLPAE